MRRIIRDSTVHNNKYYACIVVIVKRFSFSHHNSVFECVCICGYVYTQIHSPQNNFLYV